MGSECGSQLWAINNNKEENSKKISKTRELFDLSLESYNAG